MAVDLHPTQGNISTLETKPPVNTSAVYRRQPAAFRQLGFARSYTPNEQADNYFPTYKPNYYQLVALDSLREKEPIVKQGLEYIESAVISRLGNYSHPSNQIDDFVQANIETKFKKWVRDALRTVLWSGYSVQENIWMQKIGKNGEIQTWIDDLISFHPLQVTLVPNDYGIIKDGEQVYDKVYKSGVWVPLPPHKVSQLAKSKNTDTVGSLVRLPRSKRVYMAYRSEATNLYGKSLINACLYWYLYKHAFVEILFKASMRYATPLIYVKVPPTATDEMVTEPDGEVRPKSMQEKVTEMLQDGVENESALVFTQISKDQPVEVGALTTGNNFSDSFINAIDLCDDNMRAILGLPNLIMKDNIGGLGSGGTSERQIEQFNKMIASLFDFVIEHILNQAILQLIQYNFDARVIPEALHPGIIQCKPARDTELKTILDGIKNLFEPYQLNKTEAERNYIKDLLGFPMS
jgi:hypothetical protein